MSRMTEMLDDEEHKKARKSIMVNVRKVVPWAILTAVGTGIYLIGQIFGKIEEGGMTWFQILLTIKAIFGMWLGVRAFNQKFFKINPFVFRTHALPFTLVILMIILAQFMYL